MKAGIYESILHCLNSDKPESIDDLREVIGEYYTDETDVLGVPTDSRIDLLEIYSDDYGFEFSATADNIRRQLETSAAFIVAELARESASEALQALQNFMDENSLEFKNIVSDNNYGCFRHYAERPEGQYCQVYLYRNLEGEGIHIDVWEYEGDGLRVYFETTPDSVSDVEKHFDAT